uniref:Uncharacterized protein n=1 Tax=Cucumis melo TaxID=3656 RepID=A0A9I9EJ39_CUCME
MSANSTSTVTLYRPRLFRISEVLFKMRLSRCSCQCPFLHWCSLSRRSLGFYRCISASVDPRLLIVNRDVFCYEQA